MNGVAVQHWCKFLSGIKIDFSTRLLASVHSVLSKIGKHMHFLFLDIKRFILHLHAKHIMLNILELGGCDSFLTSHPVFPTNIWPGLAKVKTNFSELFFIVTTFCFNNSDSPIGGGGELKISVFPRSVYTPVMPREPFERLSWNTILFFSPRLPEIIIINCKMRNSCAFPELEKPDACAFFKGPASGSRGLAAFLKVSSESAGSDQYLFAKMEACRFVIDA